MARSSASGSDISTHIDDDLDTFKQRQNQIDRINDGRVSDAFAQYKLDESELPNMYRKLAGLVHPDKQSDPEWEPRRMYREFQVSGYIACKYDRHLISIVCHRQA